MRYILCFSILFTGHGKGLFIVPAVTSVLLFCPLTAFVWSGCTCRHTKPLPDRGGLILSFCAPRTHFVLLCAADLFCPSVRRSLSCHDVNLLSPHTQSMHSTVPSQIPSFGWSIIPAGRTSQKGLGRSCKIGHFPSPHHQTIPPLPLTSGLWPHHVPYWLGTGWWCLGLARAFLLDMSKNLPAAHAFVAIWRLSVRVF